MKFIHAIVMDTEEVKNCKEDGLKLDTWSDLNYGDYIVHCLYCVDKEEIIIIEDNTHEPVETIIYEFLSGIEYTGEQVSVTKAFIMVDEGLSYSEEAVGLCLVEGSYVEVND